MIHLKPEQLRIVQEILADHVPEFEVLAFGSRVTGREKEHSDLDLAVLTTTPLPLRRLLRLQEAFDESDLPIKVDVVDWAAADENFRAVIRQACETIRSGTGGGKTPL
jgi:predicted nucleotidyltransferase